MRRVMIGALALGAACAPLSEASAQAPTVAPAADASSEAPMVEAPAVALQAEVAPCCEVPALTAVELEFVDSASSRSSKAGETIALRLVEPLVVDGRTIASRGAKAVAEVIQASKAGLMGKAGELTFAARYVEIGQTRLPLKRFGYGRSQGSDPSGTLAAINVATAAVMPIASVALIFVSGGNVDIKAGARAHAVVATATFVPSNP